MRMHRFEYWSQYTTYWPSASVEVITTHIIRLAAFLRGDLFQFSSSVKVLCIAPPYVSLG